MGTKENNFLKKLRATFRIEADEHLRAISSGLFELRKKPDIQKQAAIIETLFREAHSLKGAARAVNLTGIEAICQAVETVFSALKRKETNLSPELFNTLDRTIDAIADLISPPDRDGTVPKKEAVSGICRQLTRLTADEHAAVPESKAPASQSDALPVTSEKGAPKDNDIDMPESELHGRSPSSPGSAEEKLALPETVRISKTKLDSLLFQAEEMLSLKLTAAQHVVDIQDAKALLGLWRKEWEKIHTEMREILQIIDRKEQLNDALQTYLQSDRIKTFFDRNQELMHSFVGKLEDLTASMERERRSMGGMIDNLLQDMKEVLMIPFSFMLEVFPRFVRKLSHEQEKEVELTIMGGDTEIDRRILEVMKDPLIHLVRNCIHHGIEKPEERTKNNKPSLGKITIVTSQVHGNMVEILISDDGRGIDPTLVKKASVERGAISKDEADKLNEQEILSLIFRSDVSTSPIITDISGRGLGLAIVQDHVEKSGGRISLETSFNKGTLFRIVLPLTLSGFRGILVRTSGQFFMIPTSSVQKAVRIKHNEVKTVENRETIQLNGHALPLVRLEAVLELPVSRNHGKDPELIYALILGSAEKRIAFRVDRVLGEQEALLKSPGRQLSRVRNVSGATVLGSGRVIPVLNVSDLMKSAMKERADTPGKVATKGEPAEKGKNVLVVEDSITSRMLLKNILESAGYQVKTTVDGVDAYTTLSTEKFDLVVSDVDMPRMNGFGLTAKIRSDRKLAELPVVLVTALESREDRERGIDVGADAYIVKSSFDQSNLLEVIQRLI
ncbi:MAG: hybrid sensor histidine kinase/response regulator [Thermodesulfobacteriota bacterium]|nr:hybrid sensor histidine kinase/response regulator [Thermodesulfobacteriota bacterium]